MAVLSVDSSPELVTWLPGIPVAEQHATAGWFQRAKAAEEATFRTQVMRLASRRLSALERAETLDLTRDCADRTEPDWSVIVKRDAHVVSYAGISHRVVQVGDLRVPIGGISAVTTKVDWRGRGYAQAILANAAAFIAMTLWAPFAVVICPEEDASFYLRLGWQAVGGRIWCDMGQGRSQLSQATALSLPVQGHAEWPTGDLDLCGKPW
jgi:hypothetical protein